MRVPRISKAKAKKLGLEIVRLITIEGGSLKRNPPELQNESVVYGLDGPQFMQRVIRCRGKPPITIQHQQSGLPIRPLCFHNGKVVRAVPIDWDCGVELSALRAKDPTLA